MLYEASGRVVLVIELPPYACGAKQTGTIGQVFLMIYFD